MATTGLDEWKRNGTEFLKKTRSSMRDATNVGLGYLFDEMRGEVSMIDHSLADLRRLDHPYATRRPQGDLHPDYLVHVQREGHGESLLQGLQAKRAVSQGSRIVAEIHSHAKHTWFLLLGTPRMRPRDFVTASMIIQRHKITALYEQTMTALTGGSSGESFLIDLKKIDHAQWPAQLPAED